MVGNDVVDLSDPDADPATRHPRFDSRVFSAAERCRIGSDRDSNQLRWRLWAAKEAAYKAARAGNPDAVFHPKEFVTSAQSEDCERVDWGRDCFRVRFDACGEFVHAIAVPDDAPARAVMSRCHRIAESSQAAPSPAEQSRAVRALATEALAGWLGIAQPELEIRSHGKIPEVWIGGARAPVELSLSHHGRAVAFAARFDEGVAP